MLRRHLLAAVAFGAYRTSELTLADALWPHVPAASFTLVDLGFATYALLHRLHDAATTRHWLTRHLAVRHVTRLGPGDALVDLVPSHATRAKQPLLPARRRVGSVRCHRLGLRPQTLLTSLLDPVAYPAADLATLHHERWSSNSASTK